MGGMLYESGPIKAVFYCPLVGEVTDDEGFSSPVDGCFLKSFAKNWEEGKKQLFRGIAESRRTARNSSPPT